MSTRGEIEPGRIRGCRSRTTKPSRALGVLALCLALVCVAPEVKRVRAQGQTPQSANLAFEVASIKPNKSGSSRVNFNPAPGGRFTATNVSAMDMIVIAYGASVPLPRSQILGGPGWLGSDRFDIVAKAEGNPTQEQFSLMLRPLLAERFKLNVHGETRERPVFDLLLARSDGRLGPRLRQSDVDCSVPRGETCTLGNYPGKLTATAIPMVTLARMLMSWVDDHREVRDRTGLTGAFEVNLEWTPDRVPAVRLDAPVEVGRALDAIDPNGPSLFTAVQEQLGLKLAPKKDQSEVLVIDHVEHPTED
jgi:uncharacterized protein (TIGR03435 family)